MNIIVRNRTRSKDFAIYKPLFEQVAKVAEKQLELQENYVLSVILVKSRKIHQINRDYRGIDRPTDVISFAINDTEDMYEMMDEEEIELGDIFINVDYAIKQAEEYGHSLKREMGFLFAHGLLHCLGYDHVTSEEDEKEMFAIQDKIIDSVVTRNE